MELFEKKSELTPEDKLEVKKRSKEVIALWYKDIIRLFGGQEKFDDVENELGLFMELMYKKSPVIVMYMSGNPFLCFDLFQEWVESGYKTFTDKDSQMELVGLDKVKEELVND